MKIIKKLEKVLDKRRSQAKKYELKYILFFTILALMMGSKGYRDIHRFMISNFKLLKKMFKLKWKKPPCNNGIISILESVDIKDLEECFRESYKNETGRFLAVDGKAMKGSIEHCTNERVKQLLKVFSCKEDLVLAHEEIDEKTNEIPVFQELVGKLGIKGKIFTLDAMHCQKKL